MAKSSNMEQAHKKLINAGLEARELRKQLAVTWLASQEIIDTMRALRAGIPNYKKSSTSNGLNNTTSIKRITSSADES